MLHSLIAICRLAFYSSSTLAFGSSAALMGGGAPNEVYVLRTSVAGKVAQFMTSNCLCDTWENKVAQVFYKDGNRISDLYTDAAGDCAEQCAQYPNCVSFAVFVGFVNNGLCIMYAKACDQSCGSDGNSPSDSRSGYSTLSYTMTAPPVVDSEDAWAGKLMHSAMPWPSCATAACFTSKSGIPLCNDDEWSDLANAQCPGVCSMGPGESFQVGEYYKDATKKLEPGELRYAIGKACDDQKPSSQYTIHPNPCCRGTVLSLPIQSLYFDSEATFRSSDDIEEAKKKPLTDDEWKKEVGTDADEPGAGASAKVVCGKHQNGGWFPGCKTTAQASAFQSHTDARKNCNWCPDIDMHFFQVSAYGMASAAGVGAGASANLVDAKIGNFDVKLGASVKSVVGLDEASAKLKLFGTGLSIGRHTGFSIFGTGAEVDICFWCDDD